MIRGRFAPSPTGRMHLGNVWTALLAWLAVRSSHGVMVLRIEDLDLERSRPEYVSLLQQDLAWLGLDWDEGPDVGGLYGPYWQDKRRNLYEAALKRLQTQNLVYPCFCSRTELHSIVSAPHGADHELVYPGNCRYLTQTERLVRLKQGKKPSLRLSVPKGEVLFQDLIQGAYLQDISLSCGDFIIRRSDQVHAYQLAVVVDDAAMKINQVVRGADLLSSTPRQILLYRLFGWTEPQFAHVPLLVDQFGRRLAKRQRDLNLGVIRDKRISAETVIGYLAWKACLIPEFQPVKAEELIACFSFAKLPQKPIVVSDWEEILSLYSS